MKLRIILALTLVVLLYVYSRQESRPSEDPSALARVESQNSLSSFTPQPKPPLPQKRQQVVTQKPQQLPQETPSAPAKARSKSAGAIDSKEPQPEEPAGLSYVVENGLAVTQGDIVLGLPPEGSGSSGVALAPPVKLWPSRTIPYHIQPDLAHPQRVEEALDLFHGTAIHFVPYDNQEHVLVFEPGEGTCKSYVGHIGGKQPVWISPGCSASDIAHEILHALGFVHEQNRADRDQYIEVIYDNVEEAHMINFEKFPERMMKVSSLGKFDFTSLMIYPPTMFARPGHSTMRPRVDYERIEPSRKLSPTDLERLNKAYSDIGL